MVSRLLFKKYPDKIPILVKIKSKSLTIDKNIIVINKNITVGEFVTIIKNKFNGYDIILTIESHSQIVHLNNSSTDLLELLYNKFKNADIQMLIINISKQTTFKYIKSIAKDYLSYLYFG